MAIIRVQHTKNYTVMSNYHLRDKSLTLKAKGLMSQMLSLPDDWDYTVDGLVAINVEQRSAIVSALKELKSAGYLSITMAHQAENGHFDYVYDLFEEPIHDLPITENPCTVNPSTDNPSTENRGANKYIDIENTDIKNTEREKGAKRFVKPTVDEIREYCEERNNHVDPERFWDYYESKGWKVGKTPMKDWRAAVRNWERGDRQETEDGQKPMIKSADEYEEMFGRNIARTKTRMLRGGAE